MNYKPRRKNMSEKNNPVATSADHILVIKRVFDAPRSLVFKMWTERDHVVQWMGPRGFVVTHADADLRPGGAWRSCIRSPAGEDLWVGGVYREIVANERLVFTHAWDDAACNPGHETIVTITLTDHGKQTQLTFEQKFFDSVQQRNGHQGGWNECFDILAEQMAKQMEEER
jgi:uncharacterized protein YndB with AHSA1/START domain